MLKHSTVNDFRIIDNFKYLPTHSRGQNTYIDFRHINLVKAPTNHKKPNPKKTTFPVNARELTSADNVINNNNTEI